jgi:hypothetical protein
MPRRSLSQSSFFDPEFLLPECLEPGTAPWLLARFRSKLFPSWLFKGWRGEGRRGRNAWPSVTLMTLLLLRWTEEGVSRLGSTRRAKTDLLWRAAMGLQLGAPTPDEKTLREFEAFLSARHPDSGTPRYLLFHEHVVRLCLQAGVVGDDAIWTMDSTPMWCYGAVLDTLRLLGDGTRQLAQRWAAACKVPLANVAEQWSVPHVCAKSTKGYFGIDWRDTAARAEVFNSVAEGAVRAVEFVRQGITEIRSSKRKGLLKLCRQLLKTIRDDLETDEHGKLAVAQHVAKDRAISLTDPQARHGRKSKSSTFNGFKLHLLGEVVSGLIAAVTVTAGNTHDGVVAGRLIRRAKHLHDEIEQVLADTAYGGAALRHRVKGESHIHLLAPPPANTRPKERLGRGSVEIDFAARTATCAAGVTTDDHAMVWSSEHKLHVSSYRWPKDVCRDCPLREECCGKRQGGHRVRLHPYERELRQAREDWSCLEVRTAYRRRSECERLVHRATRHGARRARSWGLRNAQLQAHAIAMACNLKLLARAIADSGKELRLVA